MSVVIPEDAQDNSVIEVSYMGAGSVAHTEKIPYRRRMRLSGTFLILMITDSGQAKNLSLMKQATMSPRFSMDLILE